MICKSFRGSLIFCPVAFNAHSINSLLSSYQVLQHSDVKDNSRNTVLEELGALQFTKEQTRKQ